jgi:hypothetical protein
MEYRVVEYAFGLVMYYDPSTNRLHRVDGPAVVWANGACEYYLDGRALTEAQHKQKIQETNMSIPMSQVERPAAPKTPAETYCNQQPMIFKANTMLVLVPDDVEEVVLVKGKLITVTVLNQEE